MTDFEFIQKANKVHNNKYDYSKTIYKGCYEKITILCPIHGEFEKMASKHLSQTHGGCPKCSNENRSYTTETFIQKSKSLYCDKYDYDETIYVRNNVKVNIKCKKHNFVFSVTPNNHLRGYECPLCGREKLSSSKTHTTEYFIIKSKEIHGDKYDYSKVKYINGRKSVEIICKIHGSFFQTPFDHLSGHGCLVCGKESKRNKKLEQGKLNFFNKIKTNDNYDYSKVIYTGAKNKVCVVCKEHGEFFATPNKLLRGQGCPKCKNSKGEEKIRLWLEQHNINYDYQYRFDDCKNKITLPFDFYINEYNLCIEYDGIGHYESINWKGSLTKEESVKKFELVKLRDSIKTKYCKDNNINLLRIPYTEFDNIDNILSENIR